MQDEIDRLLQRCKLGMALSDETKPGRRNSNVIDPVDAPRGWKTERAPIVGMPAPTRPAARPSRRVTSQLQRRALRDRRHKTPLGWAGGQGGYVRGTPSGAELGCVLSGRMCRVGDESHATASSAG